jgi:hypothetical protein
MTLSRSNPRARPRWILLSLLVCGMVLTLVGSLFAALPSPALFELDKDATNDTKSDAVGYLATSITATSTTLNVCQILTYGTGTDQITYTAPGNGETILLRNERMTLASAPVAGNFGGNCAGTKMVYTVTRGSNASAHKGGDSVSARISVLRTPDTAHSAGPDWNQIKAAWEADHATTCASLGLVECTFVIDGIGPSTFIGGNTKDHIDIPSWMHTSGASPDKGEILNAYAAKDIVSGGPDDGDQILYFGMDRYAVDGSTDIGFWFFKNPVYACPDANAPSGTCDGVADGTFVGQHAIGDILILGTFTQGGATSNIRVFEWVGSGGNQASGTVDGPVGAFGDCVPGSASAQGCATVNNTTIEVWPSYTFKGDALSGWAPAGGFFEGGVNLSDFGMQGCFSTFLAETRSSPELTAVLKDFALGAFEACDASLSTRPGDGTAGTGNQQLTDTDVPPDGVPDIGIGTGSVQVRDRALLGITGTTTWSGNLKFWLCGPDDLAPTSGKPATCTTGGTQIGPSAGTTVNQDSGTAVTGGRLILSDAATVTKAGTYCWRATFTSATSGVPNGTDSSVNECFEVLPAQPTISTSATAAVEVGSALDDTATLSGTAAKPGSPVINPTTAGTPAGGTITFKLYGPSATASCVDPATGVTGNLVGTSVVNVSGDTGSGTPAAAYTASDGTITGTLTPTEPGNYYWVASYSGDAPNTLSATGSCGDTDETSEVVDAYITISPLQATNESGDTHVLTATVKQLDGSGESNAPDGTVVSFGLSNNSAGADFVDDGVDSDTDGINGNDCATTSGQCTVSITTTGTGDVDIDATTTFIVSGVSLTRSTDGTGSNSDPANKIFVDASIAISPLSDTNNINSEHVFTITVTLLPLGTVTEDLVITPSIAPTPDEYADTCATPTETGTDTDVWTCTVTINHASAEEFTLNASLSVTLDGLAVTRDTDPATPAESGPSGSGPATKAFVDGTLEWLKHDQNGVLLAGATFEVCQTHYLDTSGDVPVLVELVDENDDPDPSCVTVLDDDGSDTEYSGLDADADGGEFLLQGLSLGTWTIRETAAPEGYAFDDELTQTVDLTFEDRSGNAALPFVNTRLYKLIVITCNESTNQLVVSAVTLDGVATETFGDVPAAWGALTEEAICGLTADDGAVYGGLEQGAYTPEVTIPKAVTTFVVVR